jgi:hypothetical protein
MAQQYMISKPSFIRHLLHMFTCKRSAAKENLEMRYVPKCFSIDCRARLLPQTNCQFALDERAGADGRLRLPNWVSPERRVVRVGAVFCG